VGVTARTQCTHYHSERDLIAIKFKCCDTFYACIQCHHELAGHAPTRWPRDEFHALSIRCGNCQHTLSITDYMACHHTCPACRAAFNPGCAKHYDLYFEV